MTKEGFRVRCWRVLLKEAEAEEEEEEEEEE